MSPVERWTLRARLRYWFERLILRKETGRPYDGPLDGV